jgi:uracil-DNA glycosylase
MALEKSSASIDAFIEHLARTEPPAHAYNPYYGDGYSVMRRENVRRYLNDIAARKPTLALIAEAPGYKGMRLTGVPFVSRRMLLAGIPSLELFGSARGYRDVPEPGWERVQSEQSGTIVWGTLSALGVVPMIWSSYPFHPHKPDQPLTNRAPRPAEVKLGAEFLREILAIFNPQHIVAVGNVSFGSLTAMGFPIMKKIRHPAQGGKNDFVAGLTDIVTELGLRSERQ